MNSNQKITRNLRIIEDMCEGGASPPLDEYWDKIVEILSKSVEETKEILNRCTEHEFYLMEGYFEDISYNLQSQEFIEYLKGMQMIYPNIDMKLDIKEAIDAMEG